MLVPGRDLRWRDFLRALWTEYLRDEIMDVAGALAFYAFLALFPFLLFLVSVASKLITPEMEQGMLRDLGHVAPTQVTDLVAHRLVILRSSGGPGLLTLSLVGALWSTQSAVVSLITALNRAYDVEETRPSWKVHGLALLGTLVLGAVVLVAAAITVALPFAAGAIGGIPGAVVSWLGLFVAGLMVVLALVVSYRFLPNIQPPLQVIFPGAVTALVLWLLASWGFSTYARHAGTYEVVYGALAGVTVLLLWMWISGQVVLIGAEINKLLTPEADLERIETPIERDRIRVPRQR